MVTRRWTVSSISSNVAVVPDLSVDLCLCICMLKGASWTSYWEASWELFLNLGTPQCATKSKFLCPFTQKTAATNKVYCSKITLSTFCCHNKIQSAGSVLHHCHPSCYMWPSHGSPSVTSCVSPEVLKCWSRNKENRSVGVSDAREA